MGRRGRTHPNKVAFPETLVACLLSHSPGQEDGTAFPGPISASQPPSETTQASVVCICGPTETGTLHRAWGNPSGEDEERD